MIVKARRVSQKERGEAEGLPIETQFYSRISPDDDFFFCSARADMMDGRKSAPGRLARMEKARIKTATLKLTAGVQPATLDMKKVKDNSCKPYPFTEMGISVMKYVRLQRPAIIQKEAWFPRSSAKI